DVADAGVGITPDIRDRIFDVFFTTKTTDRQRGSGLGLSVVLSVVSDHQGYVDFTSTVGAGTLFQVYLPASREAVLPERAQPLQHGSESILVVDDDPLQRRVLTAFLQSLGYGVESGEAAVIQAGDRAYDLAILDMVMPPGIDGA